MNPSSRRLLPPTDKGLHVSHALSREGRWRLCLALMFAALAACASPRPHKVSTVAANFDCGVESSLSEKQCFDRTPEVSADPSYTLHFVEFDDQGWLYPRPADQGDVAEMGSTYSQLDRAVEDVASKVAKERVLLLVYVHGWKHTAAHDDRDVKRFRQMLSDAAVLDQRPPGSGTGTAPIRSVVGIYVGWRGAGRFSHSNPLINLTFWTRKNAALHVSEGAARELFARIRALREHWNARDTSPPRLRTLVMGHSFGGWVVFSALSPSILDLLAKRADVTPAGDPAEAWRQARLRSAADMVILVNPAFEATRYQPIHNLAQKVKLLEYEPPALLLVTSKADAATGTAFPFGRFFNTLFQRPFASDDEAYAAMHTPGFVDPYVTHSLSGDGADTSKCPDWRAGDQADPAAEEEVRSTRMQRMQTNRDSERRRHKEWRAYLNANKKSLPPKWTWQYCGGTTIQALPPHGPHSPVWNVVTDGTVIPNHSDIMGEPLHAFFRQLYRDLPQ